MTKFKPYIESIDRRKDGSLIIDYYNGSGHSFRIFYYYSKKDALKRMRSILNIKRNPIPIRDYTTQPKTSLIDGLVYLSQLRDQGIKTILR